MPERVVTDPTAVLFRVIAVFDQLGIEYAVGGSVASSVFGEPRATADVDIIARLLPRHLAPLRNELSADFYLPEETMAQAVQEQQSFNLIHLQSIQKVDIFVAGDTELDREQLRTRRSIALGAEGARAYVTAPEVMVVRKLSWYRDGGEVSERQWRDLCGVLKTQGETLDRAYMQDLARDAGVPRLLQRALVESGFE